MTVSLREWRMTDAPLAAEYCNNFEIAKNLRDGFPHPYSLQDAEEYIRAFRTPQPGETWLYAVCVDGELAGSVGVFRLGDVYRRSAEVGYWLAQPYWGRGVMTQAVARLCEQVFAESDIVRIKAEVFAPNIGSQRVLQKCDFQLEGTLRKSVWKNGELLDAKLYALVKE